MADKKKKEPLLKKIKNQTAYKNYVISGGSSDFQTWQKENKQ
jgi:hypothetical protein